MADFLVKVRFTSPLYGEVDSLKLSNALIFISNAIKGDREIFDLFKSNKLKVSGILSPQDLIGKVHHKIAVENTTQKSRSSLEYIYGIRKLQKDKGEVLNHLVESDNEEEKTPKLIDDTPTLSIGITKSSIDRHTMTVSGGNLFTYDVVEEKRCKYILISLEDESKADVLEESIKLLGSIGLSKRRSVGYGKFKIEKVEGKEGVVALEDIEKEDIKLLLDKLRTENYYVLNKNGKEYKYFVLLGKYPIKHLLNTNCVDLENSFYDVKHMIYIHNDSSGKEIPVFTEGSSFAFMRSCTLENVCCCNECLDGDGNSTKHIMFAPYLLRGE